jgi:hypothetical protein
MEKSKLLEKIELAEKMKKMLNSPEIKAYLGLADKLIQKSINQMTNLLSQDLEEDARMGQVMRAEIRGMKAIRFLPENLIKQGEEAVKKVKAE